MTPSAILAAPTDCQTVGDFVGGQHQKPCHMGERHFRRAVAEFVAVYDRERNHLGLDNELIAGTARDTAGRVSRRSRLGGLLNHYERAA